jgi:hypothetical protein
MARGYWSKRGHTLKGLNPEAYTTKTDKDGNLIYLPSTSLIAMQKIRDLPFGSIRRQAIISLLQTGYLLRVNGKGCIQTKADPDLQKLLKDGKIEMYNERNRTFKRTIIRYNDGSERRKRKRS